MLPSFWASLVQEDRGEVEDERHRDGEGEADGEGPPRDAEEEHEEEVDGLQLGPRVLRLPQPPLGRRGRREGQQENAEDGQRSAELHSLSTKGKGASTYDVCRERVLGLTRW